MSVYENDDLLNLTDGLFHPGGIELTRRALALARLKENSRILDVGCGTGRTVAFMRSEGFDARGIDASDKLVRLADSPYVTVARAEDISSLLLTGSPYFDAVITECVFVLIDKPAFLSAAKRILAPDGKLILCELYRREDSSPVSLPDRS